MPIGELPLVWNAATTLRRFECTQLLLALAAADGLAERLCLGVEVEVLHQDLDGLCAHRTREVLAVTVDQLAVQELVDDELLDAQLGEGGPDLVETIQLTLRAVTELTHFALAAVLDLAADIGLRALCLELGDVGFELLRTCLEIGVALICDGLLFDLHLGFEGGQLVVTELLVDTDDDVGSEVDDLFEILRSAGRAGNRDGSEHP